MVRLIRRRLWLIVGFVTVALLGTTLARAATPPPFLNLVWIQDDYLSTDEVDLEATTAVVDTENPGRVYLPGFWHITSDILPGVVALHPGAIQAAAGTPEEEWSEDGEPQPATVLQGFMGDGFTGMYQIPDWTTHVGEIRGIAWTGDGGHLAVATPEEVRVFALDGTGLRQLTTIPVAEALAVAGGPGRDLWIADTTGIRYFAWDGAAYREIPERRLTGVDSLVALSTGKTVEGQDVLVVLAETGIGYYRFDGTSWRQLFSIHEPDAAGVALAGDGGVFVLLRDPTDSDQRAFEVVYYGLAEDGLRRLTGTLLDAPAWGIVTVPASWGPRDFAVINWTGVNYYAWDGEGWRRNYSRDIWGTFFMAMQKQSEGYVSEAWLYSTVQETFIPVGRIRAEIQADIPPGTGIELEISTDGGQTWTPIPLDTNVDVPPGNQLVYRVRLTTEDMGQTPVLDRIDLRQVVYINGQARSLGIPVKVRLVR